MTVRVLLADDDQAFRDTLARRLAASGEAEVVATASNGEEAVERYRELTPDVVLMDIVMPVCDGFEATKRIVALDADARIVAITSGEDHRALGLCLAAGARGCLKKGASSMTLAPLLLALVAKSPSDSGSAIGPQTAAGFTSDPASTGRGPIPARSAARSPIMIAAAFAWPRMIDASATWSSATSPAPPRSPPTTGSHCREPDAP